MKKILETKRLYLRELTLEDTESIFALDSNPDVMRYISTYNPDLTLEDCRAGLEKRIAYYKTHPGLGVWATCQKSDNAFIGWTTLKDLDNTDDVEVGYRYLPAYWNKGYATEASKALLGYAFDMLKLKKVVAIAMPENTASRRVMEKIGMRYLKDSHYYHTDVVYYTIEK